MKRPAPPRFGRKLTDAQKASVYEGVNITPLVELYAHFTHVNEIPLKFAGQSNSHMH